MSNLQQRKYYKIFSGTNQSEGYDKIHLGYEAATTELIFKKDDTTSFHMPFFADTQQIVDSTLGGDGAIPGPIPALADRIFKKQGNYGNTTPWGNPTGKHDGTWLCSWYYAVSNETPIWVDRYYNPGRLAYEEALEGTANFIDYVVNDPYILYYDVTPSSLSLESGVYYQYYHHGETSTANAVKTFAGNDKSRLRLDIENWGNLNEDTTLPVDESNYKQVVVVKDFKSQWITQPFEPGYQDRNALSFNNSDFIDCKIKHSETFSFENEFTLNMWINNPNWDNATSTQLIGNLNKSGFSLSYNNLNYNPFFVVPETTYGHLFYFNQDSILFNDKNTQYRLGEPSKPSFVFINSNSEVISVDQTSLRVIKYNYIGDVITISNNISGDPVYIGGIVKSCILDKDDNCYIITTAGTYIFDNNLILLNFEDKPYTYYDCFAIDVYGNLVRELSCKEVKFDNFNKKWSINADNRLMYEDSIITETKDIICSTIGVDPENNIWVLTATNRIIKFDSATRTPINEFEIGTLGDNINQNKNISFIQSYNRKTNNFTWYALIYYNFDKNLYQVTLDGKIYKNIFLPQRLNILDPVIALQDRDQLTFNCRGDFTGYEHRRIINRALYNNFPQIQFSVSVKNPNRSLPDSIYKISVPVFYFVNNFWHLVTVTVQNQNIKLFVDDSLRGTFTIPNNLSINYEYKNDLIIGCPNGRNDNINKDFNTNTIIWNGLIDSVKIYDYAIDSKFIQYFVREKAPFTDIEWNIPTSPLQYIEVIERFFKHRMPGAKSQFFKIKLSGSKITDPEIRKIIEKDIKLAIEQIKPTYTELLKVEWVN